MFSPDALATFVKAMIGADGMAAIQRLLDAGTLAKIVRFADQVEALDLVALDERTKRIERILEARGELELEHLAHGRGSEPGGSPGLSGSDAARLLEGPPGPDRSDRQPGPGGLASRAADHRDPRDLNGRFLPRGAARGNGERQ